MCKKLVRKESVMLKIVPIDTKSKKYVIKHDNVVFSDDDLIFIDIDSDTVNSCCMGLGAWDWCMS